MYRSILPNRALLATREFATTTKASTKTSNLTRHYATQGSLGGNSTGSSRKQISVMTDDGRYKWSELSGKEKVARATQQSFNFVIVIVGVVMTVGVFEDSPTIIHCGD